MVAGAESNTPVFNWAAVNGAPPSSPAHRYFDRYRPAADIDLFNKVEDIIVAIDSIDKKSSGDNKYQQYVDPVANVTKKLRLNISPIRVGGSDAISVVKTMWNILIFLEKKNRSQCYVSHLSAIHKGKNIKFGEIVGLPETCT